MRSSKSGTQMERKWNAFGTHLERKWNANGTHLRTRSGRVPDAFSVRLFLSSTVYLFSISISHIAKSLSIIMMWSLHKGEWKYVDEDQYLTTKAEIIKIKGHILYNMGMLQYCWFWGIRRYNTRSDDISGVARVEGI